MRTIDKIITNVSSQRGAPMGRSNNVPQQYSIVNMGAPHKFLVVDNKSQRIFDSAVPLSNDGVYDKGGAYWGLGKQLRVEYTKDLSYILFYRVP